jgi:hypothetical protein
MRYEHFHSFAREMKETLTSFLDASAAAAPDVGEPALSWSEM